MAVCQNTGVTRLRLIVGLKQCVNQQDKGLELFLCDVVGPLRLTSLGKFPRLTYPLPQQLPQYHITMPIAPITGKLRKRLWLDLSVALGLGVSSAYAYWYV
jgi:hypothetical protein